MLDQFNGPILYLVIAGLALFGFIAISGIGITVMWIKYSWIHRNNSKNYTGADIATKMLSKANMGNVRVVKSFFYIKYWNHNKKRGTFKLRNWTYSRKSVWTLMESAQQTYATTLRETNKKAFWFAFRLPNFIRWAAAIVGVAAIAYSSTLYDSNNFMAYSIGGLGAGVFATGFMISEVWRINILRKNVVPVLKDSGLNEKELKTIQRIFNWRFVFAVAVAILEMVKLVIQIMQAAEKYNSSSSS